MVDIPDNSKTEKMTIGKKIRRVREIRGMKQETLASILNLSQPSVSNIESSDHIEPERLQVIADALGVTKEFIENISDDPSTFTNNVYSEGNNLYNQINNPIDKVIELYDKLLAQKDEIIQQQAKELERYKMQQKTS